MSIWFKKWFCKLLRLQISPPRRVNSFKKQRFGALVDKPDDRDFAYSFSGNAAISSLIGDSADLSIFASYVKNQGSMNSCVAHAVVLAYEMELRINTGIDFDGSELQIYYDGRIKGELFPQDKGMYPRDALKVLLHSGVTAEKLWPYDQVMVNNEPSVLAKSFERWFKIRSFHVLTDNDAIRAELATKHPVITSLPVYLSFLNSGQEVPFPAVTEKIIGYHEVVILGYDNKRNNSDNSVGSWLIQNSQGTVWGYGGRAWLPYNWRDNCPGFPQVANNYSLRL